MANPNTALERIYQIYQRGDYQTAIEEWRQLAAQGDPVAQFNLGQVYRLGKGVDQNDDQAAQWYAMAARQGYSHAQHNIKLMHRDGRISDEFYHQTLAESPLPAKPAQTAAVSEPVQTRPVQTEPVQTESVQTEPVQTEPVQSEPVQAEPPLTAGSPSTAADGSNEPVQTLATMTDPASGGSRRATTPTPAPMPANAATDLDGARAWLEQLDPENYVVQLMATPKPQAIDQFLSSNRLGLTDPTSIVRTESKGSNWYVLLLGPYDTHKAAKSAVLELPQVLQKNKPWIRRVSSVQATAR